MALGAVVAAALTDHSAHAHSLWINGLDVIKEPGIPGNLYGTPIESVSIDDLGPGGVSGMTFTIGDPTGTITVNVGDEVLMWDHGADVPLFHGWVYPTVTAKPAFGGQGRRIDVQVIGPQAILDWSYFPGGTMGTSLDAIGVVQWIAGIAFYGAPGLRALGSNVGGSQRSTQDLPVGDWFNGTLNIDIAAGTLRAAIRAAFDVVNENLAFFPDAPLREPALTVDHWLGLRTWAMDDSGGTIGPTPTDYNTLTVVDTYAGAKVAADLEHTADGSDDRHQVYVVGGNADGTGIVTDGTGRPGPITVISDSTSLDGFGLLGAAKAALWDHQEQHRGRLTLEDFTPPTGVYPGSLLDLTDAATGATATYVISAISKMFLPSGRQTWEVSYGGLPASYIDTKGR